MEVDCLARPSFQDYRLPSDQRQTQPAAEPVQVVELISERLTHVLPIRLAQAIHRITEPEHMALKRALLRSVRIRKRINRG